MIFCLRFYMNLKYNETTRFQNNLLNRGKKKKKKKKVLYPLTRPTHLKGPWPKIFFHWNQWIFSFTKIYILQLEEFSVLFCYF